jgi:cysteine desulfurase / selenocysteine lyase
MSLQIDKIEKEIWPLMLEANLNGSNDRVVEPAAAVAVSTTDAEEAFEPSSFRALFPALQRPNIYLDNAATTMTPFPVIDALVNYYAYDRATIGRAAYRAANHVFQQAERSRAGLLNLMHAPADYCLIFCSGATMALNMAAAALDWQPGDNVVTTMLEHHSNFLPWMNLRSRDVEVRITPADGDGRLRAEDVLSLCDERTRLVAITHVSNVLGVAPPVEQVCRLARQRGILALVDGAQAFGHMPVDLASLGADLYAASAHKAYGPTGIGFLALSPAAQARLKPPLCGGGSIDWVTASEYQVSRPPKGWEAGTPNVADIIAWGAALQTLSVAVSPAAAEYVASLIKALLDGLSDMPEITIYGDGRPQERHSIISFNIKGISPHKAGAMLDETFGIMVRAGEHCAAPLCQGILGLSRGCLRVSLAPYNTFDEIQGVIKALSWIKGMTLC